MITAENIYKEILEMPVKERERLFSVIARKGLRKTSTPMMRFLMTSGYHLLLLRKQQNTWRLQK